MFFFKKLFTKFYLVSTKFYQILLSVTSSGTFGRPTWPAERPAVLFGPKVARYRIKLDFRLADRPAESPLSR